MAEAWGLALETSQPARRFTSYMGQRNLPGHWWSATDGQHVGYESWLERDHLMLLDFDPAVVAIASQPGVLALTTLALTTLAVPAIRRLPATGKSPG